MPSSQPFHLGVSRSFANIARSLQLLNPNSSLISHPPSLLSNSFLRVPPHFRFNTSRKLAQVRQVHAKGSDTYLRCGDRNHVSRDCRNVLTCFECEKIGHRSLSCPFKPPQPTPSTHPNLNPLLSLPSPSLSFPPPVLPTPSDPPYLFPNFPLMTTHHPLLEVADEYPSFSFTRTKVIETFNSLLIKEWCSLMIRTEVRSSFKHILRDFF